MNNHDANNEHNYERSASQNSTQRPQLNLANASGCGYCQNVGDGGGSADLDGGVNGRGVNNEAEEWNTPECETESIDGEEGLEPHQVEAPNFQYHQIAIAGHGLVDFLAIFEALARHERCTCHSPGPLPENCLTEPSTPILSGMLTPASTFVEVGSGERSMESSMYLSTQSASPMVFNDPMTFYYMGPETNFPRPYSYFITAPIRLTPEPPTTFTYSFELDPADLESSESDE